MGRALEALLYGNLFIAACAAVWTFSTYGALGLPDSEIDVRLLALVFSGVVAVYTFDRVVKGEAPDAANLGPRHRWIAERRRGLAALAVVALGGSLVLACFMRARVTLALVALAGVAGAYSVPFLRGRTAALKDVGFAKIFLIAGVWAAVTTFLPPLQAGAPVATRDVLLLALERSLFVFAITLPFDVRDAAIDAARGARTIPIALGVARTRALVVATIAVYLALKIVHYYPAHPILLVPVLVTCAYVAVLLGPLGRRSDDLYYSLLWDGAILVQAALAIVFERL